MWKFMSSTVWHHACWNIGTKVSERARSSEIGCRIPGFLFSSAVRTSYLAWLNIFSLQVLANYQNMGSLFIMQSVLWQVHSLFQSKCSTECCLVFPFFKFQYLLSSLSSCSSCLHLFAFIPSLLSFLQYCVLEGSSVQYVTNPFNFLSFYCM